MVRAMPELETNYSVVQQIEWFQWHITKVCHGNIVELYWTELYFYANFLTFSLSFMAFLEHKEVNFLPESDRKKSFVCPVIPVGSKLLCRKSFLSDQVEHLHLLNTRLYYILKMSPKLPQQVQMI